MGAKPGHHTPAKAVQSLGLEGIREHTSFKKNAATINLYTHHVICTYQTFATVWVKQTKRLAAFLNLAPRLIMQHYHSGGSPDV